MDDVLVWLATYSPPVFILIVFGAVVIYLIKDITQKVIAQQFDRYKLDVELRLMRRSKFEERILMDRYSLIKEFQTKLGMIMTNLNRIKRGRQVEGFIVNNDIVPLTEVFEALAANKYLITNRFHGLFIDQARLLLSYARETNREKVVEIKQQYKYLLERFYDEMNDAFKLESIDEAVL